MILGNTNKGEICKSFDEIAPGIILKNNEIHLFGAPLTDSGELWRN